MRLNLMWRREDGARLASTVWRTGPGLRTISSATVGGGIGPAGWVLNAQVSGNYARTDPAAHLMELASSCGLRGPGVGMMTAAAVDRTARRSDEGVTASATVGLRVPTWAAAPPGVPDEELAPIGGDPLPPPPMAPPVPGGRPEAPPAPPVPGPRPGTVNIIVEVPAALSDAALVNAVMTATEAKTQALLEAGYACTGTASDALCIAALIPRSGKAEPFAGPRSTWGARIARAVHAAVHAGALDYTEYLKAAHPEPARPEPARSDPGRQDSGPRASGPREPARPEIDLEETDHLKSELLKSGDQGMNAAR
ncbi:adenosylcobinamide amidohydrolase [Actinomadura viridis]|uniref:Adenosylcobinamide amidohydrolase n=1 Tax=Actinomadura viridis TaxID=58110 RepID=A0A931DL76_9ACTN|nr:adenosylcobinamide amidohydrolase [Actinomadura viridis]MBG6090729.1 adenosylcobinamide amidohydrolase [Actinomadura viridis]